jgi:hypothetical protein
MKFEKLLKEKGSLFLKLNYEPPGIISHKAKFSVTNREYLAIGVGDTPEEAFKDFLKDLHKILK